MICRTLSSSISDRPTASKMAIGVLLFCAVVMVRFADGEIATANTRCPEICSCLGQLVDCSKRGLTEVPHGIPIWTQYLELQLNEIASISDDAFAGLINVQELDLSGNKLRQLTSSSVGHLASLQQLKLNYNRMEAIPDLGPMNSLAELSLHHNNITSVSGAALGKLPALRTLDLSFNRIQSLPLDGFPTPNNATGSPLHQLFLNGNRVGSLQQGCLDNLTSLESLKLNKNKIAVLPKDRHLFRNLSRLKYLELNRNRIVEVEGLTFQGLVSLHMLKLKHNRIAELMDGAFFGLSSVQILQLDHNNISAVEKRWLYGLKSLQRLSISHNSIRSIEPDAWSFCPLLWELKLVHNQLVALPTGTFEKLTSLLYLYLDDNKLSNIAEGAFKGLSKLQELEMNGNDISWTVEDMQGAFHGLERLMRLSLRSNNIDSIARLAFAGLRSARMLDLTDNAITSIQEGAFADMQQLREIRFNTSNLLCDCNLRWLPDWLRLHDFQDFVCVTCAHPQWLQSKDVLDIQSPDFICSDHPKPLIVRQPATQVAMKGSNATLYCTAVSSSDSPMLFQWRKNNLIYLDGQASSMAQAVDGELDGDGKMVSYTSRLTLTAVGDDAEGWYQCVVTNDHASTYSSRARISVHVFPTFTKTPVDITVKAGSTARLECAARGQPSPVIAWQKDGGDDFPAAQQRRMRVLPEDDVFFIVRVNRADAGTYSCTANSSAGRIAHNATLTVLEPPSFVKPMEGKNARAGDTAVMECMTNGSPKPKVAWLKDGEPLRVTERHFFTADEQLLIIVAAHGDDAGVYTCEMSNTLGTERGSSTLQVVADPTQRPPPVAALSDSSTTTGVIIIAVVCCVVGTSLVWVIIIYHTRKRSDELSATNTDETALPSGQYEYRGSYIEDPSHPLHIQIQSQDGSIGSARLPNSDSSLDSLHSEPSTESTNSGALEQASLQTFQPTKREIYGLERALAENRIPQGYISVENVCRYPSEPPDHYGSDSSPLHWHSGGGSSGYSSATFPRKQTSTMTASETVRWSTGSLDMNQPYSKDVDNADASPAVDAGEARTSERSGGARQHHHTSSSLRGSEAEILRLRGSIERESLRPVPVTFDV